ncbi:hypothetical protein BaRGS_00034749 [Batillaria attramentaria]|uniref:Uncharacterized protein n=1 Tax=Batillaria attramentaria TaxID=370345 RepID=A0ABD0JGL4_9CAEN
MEALLQDRRDVLAYCLLMFLLTVNIFQFSQGKTIQETCWGSAVRMGIRHDLKDHMDLQPVRYKCNQKSLEASQLKPMLCRPPSPCRDETRAHTDQFTDRFESEQNRTREAWSNSPVPQHTTLPNSFQCVTVQRHRSLRSAGPYSRSVTSVSQFCES